MNQEDAGKEKETAVGAADKGEYLELVSKIESCILESGLPFKKVMDALGSVRERQKCKGLNFLDKVNIQEIQQEKSF